jgi:hypothetical protein
MVLVCIMQGTIHFYGRKPFLLLCLPMVISFITAIAKQPNQMPHLSHYSIFERRSNITAVDEQPNQMPAI